MNNSTISPYKYTFLLAILLITIIASISPLNSFAQEEEKERGWKGKLCNKPTCKDELRQKLLNLKKGEYVAGYIINGSVIIEIIKESDIDIKIENSVIEGGLDFTKLPVVNEKLPVDDQRIEVNNRISINNSAIGFWEKEFRKISVDSADILFNKGISFNQAQFSGEADFSEAQFSGEANFYNAQFSGEANFYNAQFSKEAYFHNAQFSGEAYFEGAQFSGKAYFYYAQFSGEANFWKAQFSGKAYFLYAQFSGKAHFSEANLQGADLRGADLQGADFREADLKRANFRGADLQGARLGEADLNGADLLNSKFGSTYLWLANLGEAKNIRYITWGEKYVINDELIKFLESRFPEDKYKINMPQIISSREYHSQGDFINALYNLIKINSTSVIEETKEMEKDKILLQNKDSILEIASVSLKSERYTIGEEKWGDEEESKFVLEHAEITYRDLKSFYKERKMHNIVSEFHYRENVVNTMLSSPPIKIFRTVFLDWTYGYGSRPLRLMWFSGIVISIFALIYLLLTLPRKTDSGIYVVTHDGRKEELLPIRKGKILLDCLYFSILSFVTFGYGALQPKQWIQFFYLEPVAFKPRRWARIFVGFEAAIGIYLLALTALVLFKG